ncbi:MAG TPA: type I restriction endonuclease [Ktedonobacteraceae bacterium]|nr:type I restriction endonuclease [Ktedonobacteraceae bacterium]
MDTSEKNLETTIETALLAQGYGKRSSNDYNKKFCLLPDETLNFIYATQPKVWEQFKQQFNGHVDKAKERFFERLASEIKARGTLEVLRKGFKTQGCHFRLAFFRPANSLNADLQLLYEANVFTVVRQLHYSEQNNNSLDLTIFLNGLPLFTAELKNDFTGQNVQDAMRQYASHRDPSEHLFTYGRCLVHFAVDPDLVYMTTQLNREKTYFLPFNQGRNWGAGNPPSWQGFATAYLWEQVWAKESVLELVQYFIHDVEEEVEEKGRKVHRKKLIFPRYHQLDAVRRLVADARVSGPGKRYLVQHSAGSGKSNTLAWLAYQLSVLQDAQDHLIFDSVIIISDRRVLDQQLQKTVRQFQQTLGVVENIDKNSQQLKDALENGKKIVVTTLQKFPVIVDEIAALTGKKFAVIIDEAHSSQTGEDTSSMKKVLSALSLEEAEKEESSEAEDTEDRIASTMRKRGQIANASFFAFTATPKHKTLELFGVRLENDKYEPFCLYTMRQAIEEGFILDVLQNYTTYKAYWSLLKTIQDDPRYDRAKAHTLLRFYVERHEQTIALKAENMIEHFHHQVAHRIGGKAKAMIVTASRLHAVRYCHQVRRYLQQRGYPYKVLVAFSGKVQDGGTTFDEVSMNGGISESKTAETFKGDEYRILIVANKFQTGFDQPLLHTMYVDKKLGGVNAVQTLSRLNRTAPGKEETIVLDFANEAEHILQSFQPYYEKTLLGQSTDPDLLYALQTELADFDFYTEAEVNHFAELYFQPKSTQDKLQAALAPAVERFKDAPKQEQLDFRHKLNHYTRTYAFLAQIIPFVDTDLEKLYQFARFLLRKLPIKRDQLPIEIQQNIAIESYRLQQTSKGKIVLERGSYEIDPIRSKEYYNLAPEELEPLSQIINEFNARFGTNFSEEDKICIHEIEERLAVNTALEASVRVNPPENARLGFDHFVTDLLQDMVDGHFKFYKQVNDDPEFAKMFLDWMFHRYLDKTQIRERE